MDVPIKRGSQLGGMTFGELSKRMLKEPKDPIDVDGYDENEDDGPSYFSQDIEVVFTEDAHGHMQRLTCQVTTYYMDDMPETVETLAIERLRLTERKLPKPTFKWSRPSGQKWSWEDRPNKKGKAGICRLDCSYKQNLQKGAGSKPGFRKHRRDIRRALNRTEAAMCV